MPTKRIELTTVEDLIKELKQLPPKAKVYTNGLLGYMHIGRDIDGNDSVTFDDSDLSEYYEDDELARFYDEDDRDE